MAAFIVMTRPPRDYVCPGSEKEIAWGSGTLAWCKAQSAWLRGLGEQPRIVNIKSGREVPEK
jgi:hypothetical protein